MKRTLFDFLELAAQALTLDDYHTAAVELRKGLALVTPRVDTASTPNPADDGIWAELRKSVDSMEAGEFKVSATCLRKALDQVKPANLDQTVALQEAAALASCLYRGDFSSMATHLREVAKIQRAQGQLAIPVL